MDARFAQGGQRQRKSTAGDKGQPTPTQDHNNRLELTVLLK